ncbi:hypothetical protein PHLCEN_2v12796 [Hermanssonia centrifuga]|uniref:SAGA-associated factor 11 n=1 Tax=Hermanssonia centrifuga TaxID=98765 RepID=A0A2R6NH22_9APHY|nr:hypothetical protein PHLCEN_2v12796 [Hermanssonia centrifuga]
MILFGQIAHSRYAPHLSSCMGLGNSRRGAVRNATTKARLSADAGRLPSPYPGSENGNISDDSKSTSKSKGKSRFKHTDEADFSLNRKRTGSPSVSPTKKSKKQKGTASPVTRVKTDPDLQGPPLLLPMAHTSSHSKIPSKLRESSILSSAQYDRRSSSPESRSPSSHSASTPSVGSTQSPMLSSARPRRTKPQNGVTSHQGSQPQRASPTRPPPPPVIHDYLVDVEGEETGSSTDTDSS